MKRKYHLAPDLAEYCLIIDSLNNLRNKLITAGKYTGAVGELLIKFSKVFNNARHSRSRPHCC